MLQGFFISTGLIAAFAFGHFLVYRTINKVVVQFYKEFYAVYQTIIVLFGVYFYGINKDTWLIFALMMLPTAHLLDSNVAFIGYLAAILLWIYYNDQEILWFYLLIIFAAPYILRIISLNRYKLSGQIIAWFISIYLLIAVAVTMKELIYSPLASVVFSSYFCSLYFFDRIFYDQKSLFIFRPFMTIRILGTILLAQIFSFNIWGSHLQLTWQLTQEYAVLFLMIALSFLMLRNIKKDISAIVYGGYFLLNIFSYLLTYIKYPIIPIFVSSLQSIYSVMTGIALMDESKKSNNIFLYLGGTGIILIQIILRISEFGPSMAVPILTTAIGSYLYINYKYFIRWRKIEKENTAK